MKLTDKAANRCKLYKFRWYLIPKAQRQHRRRVAEIRRRGKASVVFFASNLSMWRYQGVYELMSRDKRFDTHIVLCPMVTFSEEQRRDNIAALRDYFDAKGITYADATEWTDSDFAIVDEWDPDILFYPQPYKDYYGNRLDNGNFEDRLLCYTPYGIGAMSSRWSLNTRFQNIAWRLFYDSETFRNDARRLTYNQGRNVVVVGNPTADVFLKDDFVDVWKPQDKPKKRIIWAPHFSINDGMLMHRASFTWLHEAMLDVAEHYADRVQFAFKPHPRLKSELYRLPGWGRERADEYYRRWATMPNCQLEESGYIDLFMTSDAMVHDSGSFTMEYHYSKRPVMFTTHDFAAARKPLNVLARAALDAHYVGKDVDDVRRFVEQTVLLGDDPMMQQRIQFLHDYMLPPYGRSVAQNTYDEVVRALWGNTDCDDYKTSMP